MKKIVLFFFVIIHISSSISFSQDSRCQFEILSKVVKGASYEIEIMLPNGYDSTLRYLIIYCVDNWLGSKFIPGVLYLLNFSQVIKPIIVIGIGNKGDMNNWRMERTRDLTPSHLSKFDLSSEHISGTNGVTGGAENFLFFIKNELIPFVETKYLSDTVSRGYFGYSYGGLFGAYILINEPQLFQKYLLGSPSLSYDNFLLIEKLKSTSAKKISVVKEICITIGEEEDGDELKGFAEFRDCILEKQLMNLRLTPIIIEKEGHRSAILSTYFKGFKYLYGRK